MKVLMHLSNHKRSLVGYFVAIVSILAVVLLVSISRPIGATVSTGHPTQLNHFSSIIMGYQSISPQAFTADFTWTPTNPTAGTIITFTATTSGGGPNPGFGWVFGDGSNSAGGNPVNHIYNNPGSYNVTMEATDSGNTVFVTHTITVIQPTLIVTFTTSPNPPIAGQPVTFTANVTGGTPPYAYSWDLGFGSSATGNPVTHTYPTKGSRMVTVTVTDSSNPANSQQASQTVTVFPMTLTSGFTFSPASPVAGTPVTFTANVTGGTAPYTYNWNFGDGSRSFVNPTSHTYATGGTFIVTLMIVDGNAVTASHSMQITVTPAQLQVDFTFSPASPIVNQPVSFTATVTGGTSPYTFNWNFGDGSTGTGNPTSHTYTNSGSFTVVLTVSDSGSMTQSVSHIVSVSTPPLTIAFGPTTTIVGDTSFTSSISGGASPYNCNWNFGDATPTQIGCNPVHTYTATGSFTVTLTVADSHGTTQSTSNTVSTQGAPSMTKISYSHNVKSANGNGANTFTITVSNPSSITVNVQVTLTVCTSTGTCFPAIVQTSTVGPMSSTIVTESFTGAPNKYTFTIGLAYSASLPSPGGTTTVSGAGGSVSGKFMIS